MNGIAVSEAIKHLETQKELFPRSFNVLSGMYDASLKALNKQMSKKVVKVTYRWPDGGEYTKDFCPCCNEYLSQDEKYCSECGQKLDWSEKNVL